MKTRKTQVATLFFVIFAMVMLECIPTYAASRNYMKKQKGISWDLKKNKYVIFRTKISGVGFRKGKAKITKMSFKHLPDKTNRVSITFKFQWDWKPTNSEITKILSSKYTQRYDKIGGNFYYTAVDYDTGICLEEKNEFSVKMNSTETQLKKKNYYEKGTERYIWLQSAICKVIIDYPSTYKGLCFGIGGLNSIDATPTDESFFKGQIPFGKATSLYSKNNKTNAHFMRIR